MARLSSAACGYWDLLGVSRVDEHDAVTGMIRTRIDGPPPLWVGDTCSPSADIPILFLLPEFWIVVYARLASSLADLAAHTRRAR